MKNLNYDMFFADLDEAIDMNGTIEHVSDAVEDVESSYPSTFLDGYELDSLCESISDAIEERERRTKKCEN